MKPRRVRSDERGFTLIELLVSMTIGMVLLLAAFMLLDRSFTASGQIADRQDALARGRQAMENITRQLRSQVCVGAANVPMVSGTDTEVTFYGSLSEASQSVTRRTLSFDPLWDPPGQTDKGRITQSVVTGVPSPAYPLMSFTGAAAASTVLTHVQRVMDGAVARPIFRYYRFRAGAPKGDLEQLGTPLSSGNLGRVALIKVAFRAYAARPISKDDDSVVLENDVFIRISDPTEVEEGPQCI
jgi:prepilin-type N-terminal cleavage/methylation domain-containing protein